MDIILDPSDGLRNTSIFSSQPGSGAAAREQIQSIIDQIVSQANTALSNKKTILTARPTNVIGEQVINLGFKPKLIKIRAMLSNDNTYDSDGAYDGTSHVVVYHYQGSGSGTNASTNYIIMLHSGSAYNAAVCTITNNGFTLTWSLSGILPTGAINMKIEAE